MNRYKRVDKNKQIQALTNAHTNRMSSLAEDEKEKKFHEEITPTIIRPLLGDLNERLAGRSWYASDQVSGVMQRVMQGVRQGEGHLFDCYSASM